MIYQYYSLSFQELILGNLHYAMTQLCNCTALHKVQRIQGMMDIFEVRRATNPKRVFQI